MATIHQYGGMLTPVVLINGIQKNYLYELNETLLVFERSLSGG